MKAKKIIILIVFILTLIINYTFSQSSVGNALLLDDLPEKIKEMKRNSVSIELIDTNFTNPTTIGSGFLVLKHNKIFAVTNYHVIAKIPSGKLVFIGLNNDGRKKYYIVNGAIPDVKHDIAILDIGNEFSSKNNIKNDTTLNKPAVTGISMFAKTDEIIEGTGVVIIGYPLGMGSEYTGNRPISRVGIVAQQPNIATGTFIIDGVASHGNSGSPVINTQNGKLLGMICAFPSDYISAYDENGNKIAELPYNSSLTICVTMDMINKLIP